MPKLDFNNRKFITGIIVFLSVVLLVILVLYLTKSREMNQIVETLNEEKTDLIGEYQELALQFDSLIPQTDAMILQLEIEQQKVIQLIEELEIVKATNASKIREYKKELTTLRSVMKHYVFQIDSLNQLNQELREENVLVAQRYEKASQTVNILEKEKETLAKRVEIASQLEAYGFVITTKNDRGRSTRRLNKTARIEICFTLSKNITAPVGEKPIYIRITAPNSDVLIKDPENRFRYIDQDIQYSIMRVIEYESEALEVCGYWNVEEFLFEGTYKIDVFADGFHIGETTFELS